MTTESEAIAHLRALIKDPMGHVAEACEFLARVDHIGDVNKMVDRLTGVDAGWQLIDTAPKTGEVVDLWIEVPGGYGAREPNAYWSKDYSGWFVNGRRLPNHWTPFYWRKPPPKPKA